MDEEVPSMLYTEVLERIVKAWREPDSVHPNPDGLSVLRSAEWVSYHTGATASVFCVEEDATYIAWKGVRGLLLLPHKIVSEPSLAPYHKTPEQAADLARALLDSFGDA